MRPDWRTFSRVLLGLTALALAACSSTGPAPVGGWDGKRSVPKGYYLVRQGDSLSEVAAKRHINTKNLIRWNRLKPPYTLYAGRLLRVSPPGASEIAKATGDSKGAPAAPAPELDTKAAPASPGSRAEDSRVTWVWPLEGGIVGGFRAGDPAHPGLRIGCRPGEEVHAAASGQVVYSGSGLKGYGNLIIVKHNKNYLSAYGFNRRLFVKEGDSVKRGQAVSECGEGPEGAYLLHFEVRHDGASVNPILYLPPRA